VERVTESTIIGVATPRIDGPAKVTGVATYSSDHQVAELVHAWPVCATIAAGNITKLETAAAEKMTGVLAVYHRKNIGALYRVPPAEGFGLKLDERRPPFEDDVISYYGQYVAVVVARTVEQARAAAEQVKVTYDKNEPQVSNALLQTLPATTK
jgi:xanthine dehydrogenase YagR molybdenum-binding subunit